jgi:hypothetical protein
MRREENVSKTNMGDGEMHALARDENTRKSEQDKHGRWGECTHLLETRRQKKVRKTNMGDEGNAHTPWKREGRGK